jgi:Undecaprenyl-phosphate glucose phosphotransferase
MVLGLLGFADMLIVALLGYAIYLAYQPYTLVNSRYIIAVVVAALLARLILHRLGAYDHGQLFRRALGASRVFSAMLFTFGCLLMLAFALKVTDYYSRVWLIIWFCSCVGSLILMRLLVKAAVSRAIQQGRFGLRTVIIGAGTLGQRLAGFFAEMTEPSIQLLGFVDDRLSRLAQDPEAPAVMGTTADLDAMIRRGEVDQIFLALPWNATDRLRDLALRFADYPVHVRLAPDLIGFEFAGNAPISVAGLPVLRLFDRPITGWSLLTKRFEDVTIASLGLALLSPILLAVAIAIKLDSRGPVIFRQTRQGFNNDTFEVLKFRTMYAEDADPDCAVQTAADDPRITPVGRFLRRTSLDEVPQLINVLNGDMSIVGPRPHALETKADGDLFAEVVQRYAARHRVRPGITGWAQVNGWRGETDTQEKIQKRVEYDQYYIENWTLWFDLWIILKTFPLFFWDQKAY